SQNRAARPDALGLGFFTAPSRTGLCSGSCYALTVRKPRLTASTGSSMRGRDPAGAACGLKEGQMLDFLGFIATAALMVLAVNAVITFMDVSPSSKLILATLAGLWIPVVGLFVAVPLVTAAIASAWPRARAAMLSIPMPLMIGLNAGRVF